MNLDTMFNTVEELLLAHINDLVQPTILAPKGSCVHKAQLKDYTLYEYDPSLMPTSPVVIDQTKTLDLLTSFYAFLYREKLALDGAKAKNEKVL